MRQYKKRRTKRAVHYKKPRAKGNSQVPDYIRLIASVRKPNFTRVLVKEAPPGVIKSISDAALNAMHGRGVKLSAHNRSRFSKQRRIFKLLASPSIALEKKRKVLVGRGFLALLPMLLSTVLGAIGPGLFRK